MKKLDRYLLNPITGVTALLTGLVHTVHIAWLDALAGVVWTQLGTLFPAASITAFSLAPHLPIPQEPLIALFLVIGVLYVAKLLSGFIDSVQAKL